MEFIPIINKINHYFSQLIPIYFAIKSSSNTNLSNTKSFITKPLFTNSNFKPTLGMVNFTSLLTMTKILVIVTN